MEQTKIELAVMQQQLKQNEIDHQELKENVVEVKDSIKTINTTMNASFGTLAIKIDKAMDCKADKSEMRELRSQLWQFIVGVSLTLITTILGLIKFFGGRS